jgi:hypothetical protein
MWHINYSRNEFSKLLGAVPRKSGFVKFLVNAETTSNRLIRTLLMEECGHAFCQPQRADYDDEKFCYCWTACTSYSKK